VRALPVGLDVDGLRSEVARGWELDLDGFTFDPVGAGSYHWRATTAAGRPLFVTVDDLDMKQAWGAERADRFAALRTAFDVVRSLHARPWVVAPVPSADGSPIRPFGDRFSVVVHPLLDGRAGSFDSVTTSAQRAELLAVLAELHSVRPPSTLRSVPLFPERHLLTDALRALGRPWDAGPLAQRAHEWLATNRAEVEQRVAALDRAQPPAPGQRVLTHGEPHPGNLLWTSSGLRMVDWDTVALAPPERDLWHVRAEPDELAGYERATGRPVDHTLLQRHADAWQLSDIALSLDALRRPHVDDANARFAWTILTSSS
jgi:spectinomycin phosphotransferase